MLCPISNALLFSAFIRAFQPKIWPKSIIFIIQSQCGRKQAIRGWAICHLHSAQQLLPAIMCSCVRFNVFKLVWNTANYYDRAWGFGNTCMCTLRIQISSGFSILKLYTKHVLVCSDILSDYMAMPPDLSVASWLVWQQVRPRTVLCMDVLVTKAQCRETTTLRPTDSQASNKISPCIGINIDSNAIINLPFISTEDPGGALQHVIH